MAHNLLALRMHGVTCVRPMHAYDAMHGLPSTKPWLHPFGPPNSASTSALPGHALASLRATLWCHAFQHLGWKNGRVCPACGSLVLGTNRGASPIHTWHAMLAVQQHARFFGLTSRPAASCRSCLGCRPMRTWWSTSSANCCRRMPATTTRTRLPYRYAMAACGPLPLAVPGPNGFMQARGVSQPASCPAWDAACISYVTMYSWQCVQLAASWHRVGLMPATRDTPSCQWHSHHASALTLST
jgi:hypothetical protein